MLFDLPKDILEAVYDRLHVHDRLRLNAVLPKDRRIFRTTRTDRDKDRRLALACVATKKLRSKRKVHGDGMSKWIPGLSPGLALRNFMLDNADDPTVVALTSEDPELASDLRAEERRRALLLAERSPAGVVPADASLDELADMVFSIVRRGDPERLEAVAEHARRVFASEGGVESYSRSRSAETAFFAAINSRNDAMAAHLLARGGDLYGASADEMVKYVTEGFGRVLLTSSHTRGIMLRIVPLTEAQRDAALSSMAEDLDVDAYRFAFGQVAESTWA
jgi:hypothetical protein